MIFPAASTTVIALTRAVEKAMFLTKIKVLTSVVVVASLVGGIGMWSDRSAAAGQPAKGKEPTPIAPKAPAPTASAEHKAVLEKAAEAVKAIEATDDQALFQKVGRLTSVASEQARYGDKTGAAGTFTEAIKLAAGLKSEATRAEALANVGFYQAHAGLTADARKTAEAIMLKSQTQTDDYRGRVLSEVASALAAAGDTTEAVKVALSIPIRVLKIPNKDGKDVEQKDSGRRDYALKLVADAQVKAGDVAGAVRSAQEIKAEDRRLYRLGELVIAYGKAGDEAAARKLFDELRKGMEASKPPRQPNVWAQQIAMLQSATGDAAGAIKWVEKIESPNDRADALLGISVGLAHREQWKK
jgi:hypothetical protein